MGLPTSAVIATRGRSIQSGITLEAYPSTVRGLRVEIQSATANSTASSLWSSHIIGPSSGGPLRYTVPIPPSTRAYYFRGRHPAGDGYSNGPFTPVVSARPKLSPEIQRPFVPQITYQGNVEIPSGSDVFVSSAKTVKVGTQPTTGAITKTLRIPYGEFLPRDAGMAWFLEGWMRPNVAATSLLMQAPVVFPPGVTLKKFRSRFYRETTSDIATAGLNRVGDTGFASIASANPSATGWITTTGTLTEVVSTAYGYVAGIFLKGQAAASNARLQFLEVEYTMPSYNKGY